MIQIMIEAIVLAMHKDPLVTWRLKEEYLNASPMMHQRKVTTAKAISHPKKKK